MSDLTERQKLILTLVIHEHVRTAVPVGSKNLVENYRLDMSSATVRNEMSALTDMGYLRQPYTSAGREPTEEGYRYFVRNLLQQTELPDTHALHDQSPVLPVAPGCGAMDAVWLHLSWHTTPRLHRW